MHVEYASFGRRPVFLVRCCLAPHKSLLSKFQVDTTDQKSVQVLWKTYQLCIPDPILCGYMIICWNWISGLQSQNAGFTDIMSEPRIPSYMAGKGDCARQLYSYWTYSRVREPLCMVS